MTLLTMMTMTLFSFSILFSVLKHPLAMGVTLIFQTLVICIVTAMLAPSTWFSYILFLIFMGALLVLFIYVATLASNDMFKTSIKMFTLMMIMPFTTVAIMMLMDASASMTLDLMEPSSFLNKTSTSYTQLLLSNIYDPSSHMVTNFIILFLLLTLIVVVKLTSKHSGPLRKT